MNWLSVNGWRSYRTSYHKLAELNLRSGTQKEGDKEGLKGRAINDGEGRDVVKTLSNNFANFSLKISKVVKKLGNFWVGRLCWLPFSDWRHRQIKNGQITLRQGRRPLIKISVENLMDRNVICVCWVKKYPI